MASRAAVSQRVYELAIWAYVRNSLEAHTWEELVEQVSEPVRTEADEQRFAAAWRRVANQLDRKAAGR